MQRFFLGASLHLWVHMHVAFFVSFCHMTDPDYSSMKCHAQSTMHTVLFVWYYAHGTMHTVLCTRYPLPLAFVVPGATCCNSCTGGAGTAPDRASPGCCIAGSQGWRGYRAKGGKQKPAGDGIQPVGMHGKQQKALLHKVLWDVRPCHVLSCNVIPAKVAWPIVVGFQ